MSAADVMSRPVDRPDHVDASRVFDFDMFRDPELMVRPHDRLLELAGKVPEVFWTPRNGGHWISFGHDATFEAARDPEIFSNEAIPHEQLMAMLAQLPPGSPHVPTPFPLMLDPPLHKPYRHPLNLTFSPNTVKRKSDEIRALAAELIDAIVPEGRCEFVAAVAEPLPVSIFLKMFGLPLDKIPVYRALVRENLAQQADSSPAEGMQRLMRVAAIMRDEIVARRDDPRDDIISMLWALEIDGKPMTLEDMENYAVLLFIAGLDTVMNGMGYAVHHLAQDQELQARLRADPSLIPVASEEMLRRYAFVIAPRRIAKDVTFRGVPMKKDDRLMLHLPAANLDPAVFAEPERFDMDRENKSHIAFNAGIHRCVGSHLARVEIQIMYEELLARLPPFRLDPDRPMTYLCSQIIGIDRLHIVWDA